MHCFIINFIFFVCPKKTKQKKGHFAEEFFAFSKNRSKTPRHFAPESRSFLRIFCTEDLQGCALTLILIICFLFTTNSSLLNFYKSQITIFKKQIIINYQSSILTNWILNFICDLVLGSWNLFMIWCLLFGFSNWSQTFVGLDKASIHYSLLTSYFLPVLSGLTNTVKIIKQ